MAIMTAIDLSILSTYFQVTGANLGLQGCLGMITELRRDRGNNHQAVPPLYVSTLPSVDSDVFTPHIVYVETNNSHLNSN